MVASLTACDESTPASSGNSTLMTTTPTTTTDPDENAPTDKDAKQVETSGYAPDGNAGTVKYLG